ncbi:hypothetical protein FCM35_KLT19069 [Carex littledalei]|uniref:KIB1-4 beta-propeller domain-containing protein n=1 Tax=Carex littledalei TaxID=544730 RepID=A0A833RB98_9POAL|nr:hypothetical protein FCM35_KLT19069 [Carex littledalei]
MIFFYGKLYALTSQKQLISIRFGRCLEQILVEKEEVLANMTYDEHSKLSKLHLAQSCSELLLVRKWRSYNYQYYNLKYTDRFSIHRWDFGAGAWTEVSNLGGRALFLTDSFMASVPPTCFGVQANCIYYFPPSYYPEIRKNKSIIWSEFSMEDGTIRTVCHEPPIKELSSAVTWILPSISIINSDHVVDIVHQEKMGLTLTKQQVLFKLMDYETKDILFYLINSIPADKFIELNIKRGSPFTIVYFELFDGL